MRLSPDEMIFWQYGFLKLNGTIIFTWGLMFVMAVGSKLITLQSVHGTEDGTRWQNLLEIVVTGIEKQIEDVGLRHPNGRTYMRFSRHALSVRSDCQPHCTIILGYRKPPTGGSLSTTATALNALCVFGGRTVFWH